MRKLAPITVICLLLPFIAGAQHYVGIKFAEGATNVSVVPDFERSNLLRFSGGALYRYEHKKYAAIQIELNYINKGYIKDLDTLTMAPAVTSRISSIELPVMAQGFIRMGIFRPYITGGATFGYILSRSEQTDGESEQPHVYDEYDRRFEYGIAGGGGLGVKISRFELQAEVRYHYNFSFLRNPIIPNSRNTYYNSTQLMFSVSLLYLLNK
jgi:hypothetical protein